MSSMAFNLRILDLSSFGFRFSCEVCPVNFVRRETLIKHVLSQHQDLQQSQIDEIVKKIRETKIETNS